MGLFKRNAFTLGFLVLAPCVAWQIFDSGAIQAQSPPTPRRPLGIYAKVNISDEISARKKAGQSTDPKSLDAYFDAIYGAMLGNQAISGLLIQAHWDTLNPNPPGTNTSYDWRYVDKAFAEVKTWNGQHPGSLPMTIQLVVTPGFQSPKWVLDQLPSCDGLFQTPKSHPQDDCGKVTFDGFIEETDSNQFPLPWNTVYTGAWEKFLKALARKYLSRTEFVSIAVAGPTAASEEMIVPNSDNMPLQKQFSPSPGIEANNMWNDLLRFAYPSQPAYWDTDQAFIDAWDAAIAMYGTVFPGVTLVATTGSGLPNFGGKVAPPPMGFGEECVKTGMDCAAEATILSDFAESTVASSNGKSSQTSGLEASRWENQDLGDAGVKYLSLMTANLTSPSARILGGIQFNSSFSDNTYHTLKQGCVDTFPPNNGDTPKKNCSIPHSCNPQIQSAACLPAGCIPQICLAPGITGEYLDSIGKSKFGEVKPKYLIPPEQALYNVLQLFFKGTQGTSVFGGTPGDAPLNYMQIYFTDIQYAEDNSGTEVEVLESGGPTMVSAETLLMKASQVLMQISE